MVKFALTNAQLAQLRQPVAWAPVALVAFGLPSDLVMAMRATGKRAVPESCRTVVGGRCRRTERTTDYVWGPDIPFYLGYGDKET